MSDTIQRFVFRNCQEENHGQCCVFDAGMIDGVLRSAGIQCSCDCHIHIQKGKGAAMFQATVYLTGKPPITSGDVVLRGLNDAKHWCDEQGEMPDDLWVILKGDIVAATGTIGALKRELGL